MTSGTERELRPHVPRPRRSPELPAAAGRSAVVAPGALTERDRELLAHLAQGHSTARTAAAMSITPNTVRTRIRRLQRKVGVDGRGRLASRARVLELV